MFTGIVETIGMVSDVKDKNACKLITILRPEMFDDLHEGDSVAVNGICLTITNVNNKTFDVTAVPETLQLTNLSQLANNMHVNLERSLKLNDRLGGHMVQGHVDGVVKIIAWQREGDAILAKMTIPLGLEKYIIKKGYIALDGMSITVIDVTPKWFTVTFIPHTQTVTIIPQYRLGTLLNVEVDILGKYAEKLLGAHLRCNQI